MSIKQKVIFDTNIFVKLDESSIEPSIVTSNFEVYSTNAQLSELKAITDEKRRTRRVNYYLKINPTKLNLESGVWIDKLTWDDDQPWKDIISQTVVHIAGNSKKQNTWIDALIAEVAKENALLFVTDEKEKVRDRAIKEEIEILDFEQLLAILNRK